MLKLKQSERCNRQLKWVAAADWIWLERVYEELLEGEKEGRKLKRRRSKVKQKLMGLYGRFSGSASQLGSDAYLRFDGGVTLEVIIRANRLDDYPIYPPQDLKTIDMAVVLPEQQGKIIGFRGVHRLLYRLFPRFTHCSMVKLDVVHGRITVGLEVRQVFGYITNVKQSRETMDHKKIGVVSLTYDRKGLERVLAATSFPITGNRDEQTVEQSGVNRLDEILVQWRAWKATEVLLIIKYYGPSIVHGTAIDELVDTRVDVLSLKPFMRHFIKTEKLENSENTRASCQVSTFQSDWQAYRDHQRGTEILFHSDRAFLMEAGGEQDPVTQTLVDERKKVTAVYFPIFLKSVIRFARMDEAALAAYFLSSISKGDVETFFHLVYQTDKTGGDDQALFCNLRKALQMLMSLDLSALAERSEGMAERWKSVHGCQDSKAGILNCLLFPILISPIRLLQRICCRWIGVKHYCTGVQSPTPELVGMLRETGFLLVKPANRTAAWRVTLLNLLLFYNSQAGEQITAKTEAGCCIQELMSHVLNSDRRGNDKESKRLCSACLVKAKKIGDLVGCRIAKLIIEKAMNDSVIQSEFDMSQAETVTKAKQ